MEKYVIYKSFGTYHTTTEENYNARIQDVRKIYAWKGFETAQQIINYLATHCGILYSQFIIIK